MDFTKDMETLSASISEVMGSIGSLPGTLEFLTFDSRTDARDLLDVAKVLNAAASAMVGSAKQALTLARFLHDKPEIGG